MNMKYVKFYKGKLSVLSLGQTFFLQNFRSRCRISKKEALPYLRDENSIGGIRNDCTRIRLRR